MNMADKTENSIKTESPSDGGGGQDQDGNRIALLAPGQQCQQTQNQKTKRKHRRGKPKSKNANKPYKKTNWKFQVPRYNYNNSGSNGVNNNRNGGGRVKLMRSRSLVPYNTNKFLMEEHLAEVPSALLTPSGRTRDSSFSVDSEDNYFFSLPEDEEEFLTKEFANVYEKARVERLEGLTKQQLIEEVLTIEDRYSDQGAQRQQQLNVQRISAEFMSKIRVLEEKIMELSRENYNLRCQLMRSAAAAAAASPSCTAPTGAACEPTPMESSSEDSESDSSSTSSSSSSSSDSEKEERDEKRSGAGDGGGGGERCSSRSSLTNGYIENGHIGDDDYEHQQLLLAPMEEEEQDDTNGLSTFNQPTNAATSDRSELNSSSGSSVAATDRI